MTLKRIHVNQHKIRKNIKSEDKEPPLTVRTSKQITYGNKVDILDDNGIVVASIIYSPDKPLSCGARCWIETKQEVLVS